eukprot:CAMPEP_0196801760 /NCGR_PEP_ID=MMETSP1362-20130617/1537_1 /TAXON_ID=163516 /ORGANISM="Leptocylindrus danicus, Strain CCMP1856" /LENGTH=61 /DNA_ID=CAMNT_0042172863 /DNA_START=10 /DNA_END=196 /DNA_ORIENTATION=+
MTTQQCDDSNLEMMEKSNKHDEDRGRVFPSFELKGDAKLFTPHLNGSDGPQTLRYTTQLKL